MTFDRFAKYSWGVLAFNVGVVLWGAFVRATGSGAGCGSHWPSCNGEIVPRPERLDTLIEFVHRVSSGIAFLLVLVLLIWAFRAYPKGHLVRRGATWSMAFIIMEALLGAGLVLFEWVAHNVSLARAFSMAIHLVNTFLLLGALTLTGWWASGGKGLHLRGQGMLAWTIGLACAGTIVLGTSGAVTALGDTLLLQVGISPAQSPLLAQLIRLRIYHPLTAFAVGGLMLLAVSTANARRPAPRTRRIGQVLVGLFVLQLFLGATNVVLKAPVWMQLVHLLCADSVWITLILLSAHTLSSSSQDARTADAPEAALQAGT